MRSLRELIYPKFRIQKRSRKLIATFDGNQFQIIQDTPVAMAPPPSDPIANYQNERGYWYSVADAQGRVLYRRVLSSSLFEGIEVFPHNSPDVLYRLVNRRLPVTLQLVIPDLATGARLEIFGTPPTGGGGGAPTDKEGPVRPLGSYSLTDKSTPKGGTHGRQ